MFHDLYNVLVNNDDKVKEKICVKKNHEKEKEYKTPKQRRQKQQKVKITARQWYNKREVLNLQVRQTS